MKSKIALLTLFLLFSITTNSFAMDIDKSAMHTNGVFDQLIITDALENVLFDDVLEKDKVFYKAAQPETYKVKEGDNLFRIALNHQIELEDLMEWNNLKDYTIHPGDELILYEDKSEEEKKTTVADTSSVTTKQEKITKEKKAQKNTKTSESIKGSTSSEPSTGKEMTVTATAYTAYCEGCSGTTAIGIDLRANPNQKVIAVDPNIIPLGSRVWVEGYGEAIAGDTGGAIKGNKIDVFIPSQNQALEWGRKKVKVKILN